MKKLILKKMIFLLIMVLQAGIYVNAQTAEQLSYTNEYFLDLPDQKGYTGFYSFSKFPAVPKEQNRTIEFWTKIYQNDGYYRSFIVMGNQNNGDGSVFSIGYRDKRIFLWGHSRDIHTDVSLDLNTWTHIAVVYTGNNQEVKVYKNGVLGYTGTWTIESTPSANICLSDAEDATGWGGGHNFELKGALDEIRYWQVAKTQTEIVNLMQQSFQPNSVITDLKLYYNFESEFSGYFNNMAGGATANYNINKFNLNTSTFPKYARMPYSSSEYNNNRLGNFTFAELTKDTVNLKWNKTIFSFQTANIHIQASELTGTENWKDFKTISLSSSSLTINNNLISTKTKLVPGLKYRFKVEYVNMKLGSQNITPAPSYYGNSFSFSQSINPRPRLTASSAVANNTTDKVEINWTYNSDDKTFLDNNYTGWYMRIERASTDIPAANYDSLSYTTIKDNIANTPTSINDDNPVQCKYNYYRISYVIKAKDNNTFQIISPANHIAYCLVEFPIDKPIGIESNSNTCNQTATITWAKGGTENPTGYKLQYRTKTAANPTWTVWNTAGEIIIDDNSPDHIITFTNSSLIYNFRIASKYKCGYSEWYENTKEIKIDDIKIVFDESSLSCSKGYDPENVAMDIKISSFADYGYLDKILVYRRSSNTTENPVLLATIDGTSTSYIDLTANTGVLYEYFVIAKKTCSNGRDQLSFNVSLLNGKLYSEITDKQGLGYSIGFRYAEGIITGKITFEGGFPVPNTKIFVSSENATGSGSSLAFNNNEPEAWVSGTLPESYKNATNMTLSAMVKIDSTTNVYPFKSILSIGNSFGIYYMNNIIYALVNTNVDGSFLTYDRTNLPADKFTNLTLTWGNKTLTLYVNGVKVASGTHDGTTIRYYSGENYFGIGGSSHPSVGTMKGKIDDVRVFNKTLTETEVFQKYNSIITPDEPGLIGYWRFDEGSGTTCYDLSQTNGIPNKFDLKFTNAVTWSRDIPSISELGYTCMTNANGNYSLRGIMYYAGGENFTVIPSKKDGGYDHQYDPAMGRTVFIGDQSQVINSIDFTDVSSFTFTGRVIYEGTTCGSSDVGFSIDGTRVMTEDNEPFLTDATGIFSFQVPIGTHTIKLIGVERKFEVDEITHTFTSEWTRETPFIDKTKVKIVGRVLGSEQEFEKACKAGTTTNNLGVATVTFTSINNCIVREATTNSADGYYSIELPPAKYKQHVQIDLAIERGDQTWQSGSNPSYKFGSLPIIDVLYPQKKEEYDSIFITNAFGVKVFDKLDTIRYNYKNDIKYLTPMSISVTAYNGIDKFVGEKEIKFYDGLIEKTLQVYPGDDITQTSVLNFPVFVRNRTYGFKLKSKQTYVNYDTKASYDYPVEDAQIRIINEIGKGFYVDSETDQPVFYGGATEQMTTNSEGVLFYKFRAGEANTQESSGFLRNLNISVLSGSDVAHWGSGTTPFNAYVFGASGPDGTDFVTETPELVDYILRDPPGSQSYSYLDQGQSFTTTSSIDGAITLGGHINVYADFAPDVTISGGIVPTPEISSTFVAAIGLDLTTTATVGLEGTFITENSVNTRVETSSDTELTGSNSDLYIGKSYNILMSRTDEITLLPIAQASTTITGLATVTIDNKQYKIGKKSSILATPHSVQTTFIYSQYHIVNNLIPNLITLRNSYFTPPSGQTAKYLSELSVDNEYYGVDNDKHPDYSPISNPFPSYTFDPGTATEPKERTDQVRWCNQQIKLWQDHIALNEKAKIDAEDAYANISFSGGNSYDYSKSSSKTTSYSQYIELALNSEQTESLGGEAMGVEILASMGFIFNVNSRFTEITDTTTTNTVGYVLQDDDLTDYFSVDIFEGSKTRGPIFKTVGGRSSCPYEGIENSLYHEPGTAMNNGTLKVEKPKLEVTSPALVANVPAANPAVFNVVLKNESETGNGMNYRLFIEPESNPYGAIIKVNGVNLSSDWVCYVENQVEVTLTIERGPVEYEYNNIKISLGSMCQSDPSSSYDILSSTIDLSAHFIQECTDLEVLIPSDNWIVNIASNDQLNIFVNNFDLQHKNFEKVTIEYKAATETNYIPLVFFYTDANNSDYTSGVLTNANLYKLIEGNFINYTFTIDNQYPDQNYQLRAIASCRKTGSTTFITTYTDDKLGIKDTQKPVLFGNTEPASGVLTTQDIISAQFSEPINPIGLVRNVDIKLEGRLNGQPIQHDASLEFGSGVQDNLTINDLNLAGEAFTIEFYAKKNTASDKQILFNQGIDVNNDLVIGFNNQSKLFFELGSNSIVCNTATGTDWIHYAITYTKTGEVKIFVDGSTFNGVTATGFIQNYSGTGKMTIGNKINASGNVFKGKIHEVRFWKKALTAAEIALYKPVELVGNESGLMYNWRLNELNGDIAYDIVRSKQAIVNATWNTFPVGYAISGFSNTVFGKTPSPAIADGKDFTVEFWFNGNGTNKTILSNGRGDLNGDSNVNGWAFNINANGKLEVVNNGNSIVSQSSVNNSKWYHVALIKNSVANTTLYINGEKEGELASTNFKGFSASNLFFGARGYTSNGLDIIDQRFTGGSIDEFRVWNSARKLDQINRDMYIRLVGDETGLLKYFPFDSYVDATHSYNLSTTSQDPNTTDTLTINNTSFVQTTPLIRLPQPMEVINSTFVLNNDKFIITPLVENKLIENIVMDITIKKVEDLNGNSSEPLIWTAFVDKNQVIWEENYISKDVEFNTPLTIQTQIVNRGGLNKYFEIENIPSWLNISPSSGYINPSSNLDITITVDAGTPVGWLSEDLILMTDFGFGEKLSLDIEIYKNLPENWIPVTTYSDVMSITGQLKIENVISNNNRDAIAAFVGNECRGLAKLEYNEFLDQYYAMLTVFGNPNEIVSYKIWNAENAEILIVENISNPTVKSFSTVSPFGSLLTPIIFEGGQGVENLINLDKGYNWVSFNLLSTLANDPKTLLKQSMVANNTDALSAKDGKIITYSTTNNAWNGSTFSIKLGFGYKFFAKENNKIYFVGKKVKNSDYPITLNIDWNWIGYIGTNSEDITTVFSNFNAQDGDFIKSKNGQFSQFYTGMGWQGSLKYIQPNQMYMMKVRSPSTFVFPENSGNKANVIISTQIKDNPWSVDANIYPENMSTTTTICNYTCNNGIVAAFIDNECRGYDVMNYIDFTGQFIYYVPVHGSSNDAGKTITYKFYDANLNKIYEIEETLIYNLTEPVGNAITPICLNIKSETTDITNNTIIESSITVSPNPVSEIANLEFNADYSGTEELIIYDITGKIVYSQQLEITSGNNKIPINVTNLSSGTYLISIKSERLTINEKLIIQQ